MLPGLAGLLCQVSAAYSAKVVPYGRKVHTRLPDVGSGMQNMVPAQHLTRVWWLTEACILPGLAGLFCELSVACRPWVVVPWMQG